MKKVLPFIITSSLLFAACSDEPSSSESSVATEETEKESKLKLENVDINSGLLSGSQVLSIIRDLQSRGMADDDIAEHFKKDSEDYYALSDEKDTSIFPPIQNYVLPGTGKTTKEIFDEISTTEILWYDFGRVKTAIADFEPEIPKEFSKKAHRVAVMENSMFQPIEYHFLVEGDKVALYMIYFTENNIDDPEEQIKFGENTITVNLTHLGKFDVYGVKQSFFFKDAEEAAKLIYEAVQRAKSSITPEKEPSEPENPDLIGYNENQTYADSDEPQLDLENGDDEYSEDDFVAEFIESYIEDYAAINIDAMDIYFSEGASLLEEQKNYMQSLIDRDISLELLNVEILAVEYNKADDSYTVTTSEQYIINNRSKNTVKDTNQTTVYTVTYGYTDELLISTIDVQ